MIQSLPSGSRQYVSNHLTTDRSARSCDKPASACDQGRREGLALGWQRDRVGDRHRRDDWRRISHFCGLGGDAVWLVADREGRRAAFLGIGQAAQALPTFDGPVPTRGPLSMLTTACAVDSRRDAMEWSAREWGGHASSPALLADAIAHARDGFPVSELQAFWLAFRRSEAMHWPGFAPAFMPDGPPGSLFRQDGVARTLQAIATEGPRQLLRWGARLTLHEIVRLLFSFFNELQLQGI